MSVRLVRSSATLTCPARTRCATSSAVSPFGSGGRGGTRDSGVAHRATLPIRGRAVAGAQATSRYRDTRHDAGTADHVLPASRSGDRTPLHPLRPARVPRVPARGVGRFALRRVREGGRSRRPRQRVGRVSREAQNLLATKAIIGHHRRRVRRHRAAAIPGSTAPAARRRDLVLYGPLVHHGEWWRIFTVVARPLRASSTSSSTCSCCGSSASCSNPAPVRCGSACSTSCRSRPDRRPYCSSSPARRHRRRVGRGVRRRRGGDDRDAPPGHALLGHRLRPAARHQSRPRLLHPRRSRSPAHIGGAIGGLLAAEAMLQARKAGHPELGVAGRGSRSASSPS